MIVHHADLDTVWELEEADIDALEDTLEILVERVSAKDDFPGVTIDTDEREHYVIGDGVTAIKGGRDAVIGWLARGLRPTACATTATYPRDRHGPSVLSRSDGISPAQTAE